MSRRRLFGTIAVIQNEDGTMELDPAFVEELNEVLRPSLVGNTDVLRGGIKPSSLSYHIIEAVTVQTTETRIGHGLGIVPHWVHINMHNPVTWTQPTGVYEMKRADETYLYLIADLEVVVDIKVEA